MELRRVYLTGHQLELLDEPLAALGLPVRTLNLLENNARRPDAHEHVIHLLTVRDLLECHYECVSSMSGIGATTFALVMKRLTQFGFDERIWISPAPVVLSPISVGTASEEDEVPLEKIAFKFGSGLKTEV